MFMTMFPASPGAGGRALETHGVFIDWEMKLHEEVAHMPLVSTPVVSLYTSSLQCLLHYKI